MAHFISGSADALPLFLFYLTGGQVALLKPYTLGIFTFYWFRNKKDAQNVEY
jgi:hypothetical protein